MTSYWFAIIGCIAAWFLLYERVSVAMTKAGIGWVNAMQPDSQEQFSAASKATFRKHEVFALLMVVALVALARLYPHYRNWTYGIGLVWNIGNRIIYGAIGLVVILICWIAGV